MSARAADPQSLWQAITAARETRATLSQDIDADVAIVGAGFSGLSAAHAVADRGLCPVVLEARHVGWGASGRNGGVVSAKFRQSYSGMASAFGLDVARDMHRLTHDAVDALEAVIERFSIQDAGFGRVGSVLCAHNERSLDRVAQDAAWQQDTLGDRQISVLSRQDVRDETGSDAFVGGILYRDVGCIQPLAYVRGLARALDERGDNMLFENTPVESITRSDGSICVQTRQGSVTAGQVIIATNGYSDLSAATKALDRRIVPFRSAIIATDKLPEALFDRLLPTNRTCSETRRMMRWFRKIDGRFIFGGRGAFGREDSAQAFDALERAMKKLFPQLDEVATAFRWSGHVAMTLDKLPHVGRLDQRTVCCLGYNGAGIALSSYLGGYAGRLAAGEVVDVGPLDLARLKPIPFYPLQEFGVRSVAGWYQFLDTIGL